MDQDLDLWFGQIPNCSCDWSRKSPGENRLSCWGLARLGKDRLGYWDLARWGEDRPANLRPVHPHQAHFLQVPFLVQKRQLLRQR